MYMERSKIYLVCTGGPDNQVHFEGYQVSNQCMALVRDECLLPCRDAPELGYAKESSSEQYVPDVFYKVQACILTLAFTNLYIPCIYIYIYTIQTFIYHAYIVQCQSLHFIPFPNLLSLFNGT